MNRTKWRAFYLKRGKYKDGREKIVIAWWVGGLRKILTLPEPEKLREILSASSKGSPKNELNEEEQSAP